MAVVPAAAQALAVLVYLSRQARPVPAAAISRDVALPRSTTYHLLDTLVRSGFVVHLPEEGRYGLGVAAHELGSGYSRQAPLARLARVPLTALVDRTGHSAHLAVMHGRDVVYVIEERSPGNPPLVSDVGVRLPAVLTATGRAMLATLSTAQIRALYPSAATLVQRNELGPRSLSDVRRLLADTQKRGHAEEESEVTHGYSSVAIAVADHSARAVASVGVTFRAAEVTAAARARIVQNLARTTREIEWRLGVSRQG